MRDLKRAVLLEGEGQVIQNRELSGVSVVICCHNSAGRLPMTLAHLAAQQVPREIPWEVLVVDNASTDNTAIVATTLWPSKAPARLRVIPEPRLGLTHARQCGFRKARYEFINFVDDDNWVSPEWVRMVAYVMSEHPEVGVCAGVNEAACETDPPWWFEKFKVCFAISPDDVPMGDVTNNGPITGAGMTIRRTAWQSVLATGYQCFVQGREGNALTAGEDTEICLALGLAGWRYWREPRLRLRHFLPADRLDWMYLRRIFRGSGMSAAQLDSYSLLFCDLQRSWQRPFLNMWQWHFFFSGIALLRHPWRLLTFKRPHEGDPTIFRMESIIGRLVGLFRWRGAYRQGHRRVRELLLAVGRKTDFGP
jgi:glycosyltransferase involved in cell wall biosynthesis